MNTIRYRCKCGAEVEMTASDTGYLNQQVKDWVEWHEDRCSQHIVVGSVGDDGIPVVTDVYRDGTKQ